LQKEISAGELIETEIKKKSLERAKHEGIDKHERFLKDKNFIYYNDL
jgi:hypothetical protein